MSLSEQFSTGMGTMLGLQAGIQSGITTLAVLDLHMNQAGLVPERAGTALLAVDGVIYQIHFRFTDETFDQRTHEGYQKMRNPKARIR